MRKSLITSLLVLCLLFTPACGLDLSLSLGDMGFTSKLTVEEWAQANVLKALDELISDAQATEPEVPDGEPDVPEVDPVLQALNAERQ